MTNISLHALSILKKHVIEFHRMYFRRFCRSMAMIISCYAPFSHFTAECQLEVCVRENGKQSKPFHVGIGLLQGCVLSLLFFIVYMNWIDKYSQADECAKIGNCKISRLLFADDWFCFLPQNLASSVH